MTGLRVQPSGLHARGWRKPVRRSLDEAKSCSPRPAIPTAVTPRPASVVLNFDTNNRAGSKALLDWYVKQFAKIGVQLEVRATDYNRFQDKMTKGSVQIFLLGLARRLPGRGELPVHALRANAKALTNGNGENNANYQNPSLTSFTRR